MALSCRNRRAIGSEAYQKVSALWGTPYKGPDSMQVMEVDLTTERLNASRPWTMPIAKAHAVSLALFYEPMSDYSSPSQ